MKGSSSFAKVISREHLSAVRALGYALHLGEAETWRTFTEITVCRLAPHERASLAVSALDGLPQDHFDTVLAAFSGRAGFPVPALMTDFEEAAHWADHADSDELEAYCLATFNRMSPPSRAAFVSYVSEREAA